MDHEIRSGPLPGGSRFAFTILDDTDDGTVDNLGPIYELLAELGMRTTKTVWPLDCPPGLQGPFFAAETLQDPKYLDFVRSLVDRGFELAFHNATMGSSLRDRTEEALSFLEGEFGSTPVVHCNHGFNRENLYWGSKRYRSTIGTVLRGATRLIGKEPPFEGEDPDSPYFWGDLCKRHFRFVRGFTFRRLDIRTIPPGRPYRDPTTQWVNYWFSTGDAPDVAHFRALVSHDAIDRLIQEGGICIISTHLGKGFVRGGKVDPEVEDVLRRLASLGGWFAPVSEILEHRLGESDEEGLTRSQRIRLEASHILDRSRGRLFPAHADV